MAAAAGGKAVPGWVPAIPELELALKVLASDSVVISDKLLVERYGEALFAATGFTKRAEMINGRLAVRAPAAGPSLCARPAPSPAALRKPPPVLARVLTAPPPRADAGLRGRAGRHVQG